MSKMRCFIGIIRLLNTLLGTLIIRFYGDFTEDFDHKIYRDFDHKIYGDFTGDFVHKTFEDFL